ncbi:DUF6280 family protein [Sulfitobacter sp. HNIBRBA2951]|uniref:DUF6280 family protein n=1 Tax=Sulfitobacter aquimarinus TaxID=3158557 RepID=UPI0032DE9EAE
MRHDQTLTSMQSYQQLFASVVLAALDDAIIDEKTRGNGVASITSWAQSRDGHTVLRCAGIEPCARSIEGLQAFVRKGIKTSAALTRVKNVTDEIKGSAGRAAQNA